MIIIIHFLRNLHYMKYMILSALLISSKIWSDTDQKISMQFQDAEFNGSKIEYFDMSEYERGFNEAKKQYLNRLDEDVYLANYIMKNAQEDIINLDKNGENPAKREWHKNRLIYHLGKLKYYYELNFLLALNPIEISKNLEN
jgi:hypothetical protein